MDTYYLDLSSTVGKDLILVRKANKLWVCPVQNNFVDTIFKGFSPNIRRGELNPVTFDIYKVNESETYSSGDVATRNIGNLWTGLHEPVMETCKKPYIAAEHSGQQNRKLLEEYTQDFRKDPVPLLNVLQCSTIMEMGVDIGSIELVLLNTVPPSAANYLQRVSR